VKANKYSKRYFIIYSLIGILFVIIFLRLLHLQVLDRERFKKIADKQHNLTVSLFPKRGSIFDRNGNELAGSI